MKKSQPIRVIAAHRPVFTTATELRRGMGERDGGRVGEGGREIKGRREGGDAKNQNVGRMRAERKQCNEGPWKEEGGKEGEGEIYRSVPERYIYRCQQQY